MTSGYVRSFSVDVSMDFMYCDQAADSIGVCSMINDYLITECLKQPAGTPPDSAVAYYARQNEREAEDSFCWMHFATVSGKASYGFDCIVNYTFDEEIYDGGAHPICNTKLYCFNALTGNRVTIDDVVTSEGKSHIPQLLTNRLMEQNGVDNIDDLNSLCIEEISYISGNIALEQDSILFLYNVYEIAPYMFGSYPIRLGYDELRPYLR